ncbi:MAG: hypothetical protein HY055_09085 [Magnetospirillum sp.]|nr:hypothetical protein [Magnetospirillum sp.]
MAVMVPDFIDEFARRRFEAKRCVWKELLAQLPEDHTVFTMIDADLQSLVDFVILTPTGLVFMKVEGGIVDVLAAPQPGIEWTHRGHDGYFIGAIRPERLSQGARDIIARLIASLPAEFARPPEDFGLGVLHVLPDTQAIHAPGIDLASPQRQVLVTSDLGRLGEWVGRASAARPASPVLSPGLQNLMIRALTQMVNLHAAAPARFLGVRHRHIGFAAAIAALAIVGLVSANLDISTTTRPTVPPARQESPTTLTLPDFIPAKAEWAVRGAAELAGENPGRPIKWRQDDLGGTVTLLAGERQRCGLYQLSLTRTDTEIKTERRLCR